jgi:hypothetical protein
MNAVHPPEEHLGLQSELLRLARENEALRESARLWIRMYERRLAREKSLQPLGEPGEDTRRDRVPRGPRDLPQLGIGPTLY